MDTLVVGGSGFVGGRLVRALLSDGHHVALLNRGRTPDPFAEQVERLVADRTDAGALAASLRGRHFDAVYDVSGFVMAAGGADHDTLASLLDGSCGRFVYVSSIMAYDQALVGRFPWTEDFAMNTDGPSTYGGFKAASERALLTRHSGTGFPAVIVRPAAIYGPENNIFDMETPMFLRLLQHRPILVPHQGLVVGSYGHVDDLCETMIVAASHPAAPGQIFNVTTDSADVATYIATLSEVVGEEAHVVSVPDTFVDTFDPPVYGHLLRRRHHAMLSNEKLRRVLGIEPAYRLRAGHLHTYDWFRERGWDRLDVALRDPLWKASWDFDAEAGAAAMITEVGSCRE